MPRRVAITGAAGQLGRELVQVYRDAGDTVLPLSRPDFDITRAEDLRRLAEWHPDVVVNSAAWTDVDGCARDAERAMRVNGEAAGAVAEAAARAGALIVQISTNEVFDGTLDRPYTEDDAPNPINPYGASKLAGERLVAAANPRHIIVRTAWLFGPGGANFVTKVLAAAERVGRGTLQVVEDEWGNPTPTPWLAAAIRRVVSPSPGSPEGIRHLVGMPPVSRHDWACHILRGRQVDLRPTRLADYRRASTVPPRAVLQPSDDLGAADVGDWRAATDDLVAAVAL